MKAKTVEARLVIFTVKDVLQPRVADQVLHILRDHGFRLDVLCYAEPTVRWDSFSDAEFRELWVGCARPGGYSDAYWDSSLVARGAGAIEYLTWRAMLASHSKAPVLLSVGTRPITYTGAGSNRLDGLLKTLVSCGRELFKVLGATFGYVTPVVELETEGHALLADSRPLADTLPGLYWTTFVGQPWAEVVYEQTRAIEGLRHERRDELLVIRMDAPPVPDCLPGAELPSRLQSDLAGGLSRGLPPVSYVTLMERARAAVVSPPEATGAGIARWPEVTAGLRGVALEDTIRILSAKGQSFVEEYGLDEGTGNSSLILENLGAGFNCDFWGAEVPTVDAEFVAGIGAYVGELLRTDLGGKWDTNPVFPDFPALRNENNWAYPFGIVERFLSRQTVFRPEPLDFYEAYKETRLLSQSRGTSNGRARFESFPPDPFAADAEEFVREVREQHGIKLDFSLDGLGLLDLLYAPLLATKAEADSSFWDRLVAYLGETLRRLSGGHWMESQQGRVIRLPTEEGRQMDVMVSIWPFRRRFRGMYHSFRDRAPVYAPDLCFGSYRPKPMSTLSQLVERFVRPPVTLGTKKR